MTDVRVGGVVAAFLPSASRSHVELQGFVWQYDDERAVTGRPDNSGLDAAAADVAVTTIGGSVVSSHAVGAGRLDVLGWLAIQQGAWYGQDHDADAFALEAGYQWPRAAWAPWLRAGWLHAGGDRDAADATHGTFFPMLPTVRRFSQTTAYSTMNLRDAFVQLQVQPGATTTLRLDLHRLTLASSADRWYAGSGATLSTGSNFGYVGRPSHGSSDLGASTEASVSWDATGRWNLNGFVGTIAGGDVVTGTFAGSRLWFAYVESVLRLDLPWR